MISPVRPTTARCRLFEWDHHPTKAKTLLCPREFQRSLLEPSPSRRPSSTTWGAETAPVEIKQTSRDSEKKDTEKVESATEKTQNSALESRGARSNRCDRSRKSAISAGPAESQPDLDQTRPDSAQPPPETVFSWPTSAPTRAAVRSRSIYSSHLSSPDPCRDLAQGPHLPPNPMEIAVISRPRLTALILDPFTRYMSERLAGFRPTVSLHNPEILLNNHHPYQNMPEPTPWPKKFWSWFSASDTGQNHTWPQPITFNVTTSLNPSTSSFFPRQEPSEPSGLPVYTAQAVSVGRSKQQEVLVSPGPVHYCCF